MTTEFTHDKQIHDEDYMLGFLDRHVPTCTCTVRVCCAVQEKPAATSDAQELRSLMQEIRSMLQSQKQLATRSQLS